MGTSFAKISVFKYSGVQVRQNMFGIGDLATLLLANLNLNRVKTYFMNSFKEVTEYESSQC